MNNQSSSVVNDTSTIKVDLILNEAKNNYLKGQSSDNLHLSYLLYKTALLEKNIPINEQIKICSNCSLILDKLSQEQFYVNDIFYFISKVFKLYNKNNMSELSDKSFLGKFCCRIFQNFFKGKANYILLYLTKEIRNVNYNTIDNVIINLIQKIKEFVSKEIEIKKEKYFSNANLISSFIQEYNTLFITTATTTIDSSLNSEQYIISNKWFKSLHNFVQALSSTEDITNLFNVDNVREQWCNNISNSNDTTNSCGYYCGEVNNADIIDYRKQWETSHNDNNNNNRAYLRKGLTQDKDYVIVNQTQFDFIKKYFGIHPNMIITYNNNNDYIDLPIIIVSSYLNSQKKCLSEKRYLRIHKSSSIEDIKLILQQCLDNYFSINKDEATSSITTTPPIHSLELYSTTNITTKNKFILTLSFIIDSQRFHFDYITNLQLKPLTSIDDILSSLSTPKTTFIAVLTHSNNETPLITVPSLTNQLRCFKCNDIISRSELSETCNEHPTLCRSKHYCSTYCLNHDNEHKLFHSTLKQLLHIHFNLNELLSSSLEQFTSHRSNAGLTGLDNIGNTCFMNSALQCLSHCEYLTLYFLNDSYKSEINSNTKYGSGGEIANGYSTLINELWLGNSSHIHPREFRNIFIRFAKQFAGFSQHDSHEMLTFMLDGLHEDLNRNKDKPYIEMVDQKESESDAEASERFWNNMLRRDNSIIVDLFYGQYKSTLQCPVCDKISMTYDPFMCLGVPITSALTADVLVIDVHANEYKVINMNVSEKDTFGDFVKKNVEGYCCKDVIGVLCGDDMVFKRYMQENDMLYKMVSVYSDFKMVVYVFRKDELKGKRVLFVTPMVVKEDKKEEAVFYPRPFLYEEGNTVKDVYEDVVCYYKCCYGDVKGDESEIVVGDGNNDNNVNNNNEEVKKEESSVVNVVEEENNKGGEEKDEEKEDENDEENIVKEDKRGGGGKKNKRKQNKKNKRKAKKIKNQQKNANINNNTNENDNTSENTSNTEQQQPQETNNNNTNKFESQPDQSISSTNATTLSITTDITPPQPQPSSSSLKPTIIPELTILNNLTQPSKNKYPCDYCKSFTCNNCAFPFKPTDTISTLFSSQSKPRSFLLCLKIPSTSLPSSNTLLPLYPSINETLLSSSLHFKQSHTLTTCIESFLQKEILDENNMWYCPSCKEHRQAFKQIQLMKLPRYLIIQLKRFKNETSFYYGNSKNSIEVDFPLHNLNMNKYIHQSNTTNTNTRNTSYVYDLFAISQHYGISFGGHYTAFIKHNNTWYDFDDETVRQVHSESLVSSNAYLLFYKLKE